MVSNNLQLFSNFLNFIPLFVNHFSGQLFLLILFHLQIILVFKRYDLWSTIHCIPRRWCIPKRLSSPQALLHKKWSSILRFLQQMWPYPFTFTEEILSGKLHFLYSNSYSLQTIYFPRPLQASYCNTNLITNSHQKVPLYFFYEISISITERP